MTRLALVLLAVISAASAYDCFNDAIDVCMSRLTAANQSLPTKCELWSCAVTHCDDPAVVGSYHKHCNGRPKPPLVPIRISARKRVSAPPNVHSPCLHVDAPWTEAQIRAHLLSVSLDVYRKRADEHYTEGNERWVGIDNHVCPSSVPRYSDCSSCVTWIYWTLFGGGPDFLNAESWKAGYTGTLIAHGTNVPADTSSLAVGDLCFYYHPMHHVSIYVGGGKVVSHGADPVGYFPFNFAPIDSCRRYI